MERREVLTAVGTGTMGIFAGCLNSGEGGESTEGDGSEENAVTTTHTTTTAPQNPWEKDEVTVAYEQEVNARHGFTDLIREALGYWEENSETYTDYSINYRLKANEDNPDIRIILVDEITSCGEVDHDEEPVGCAPLISDRAPETAEVEIVDGYDDKTTVETLKHELGHTLGLNHDDEPQVFMSNDVEDRIPQYEKKMEILDRYGDGISERNEGIDYWNAGVDEWDDEAFASATEGFNDAIQKYEEAINHFEDAVGTTEDIEATEAKKICEAALEFTERELGAVSSLKQASEEAESQNYDDAEEHRKDANEKIDELGEVDIEEGETLADALDLPGEKY